MASACSRIPGRQPGAIALGRSHPTGLWIATITRYLGQHRARRVLDGLYVADYGASVQRVPRSVRRHGIEFGGPEVGYEILVAHHKFPWLSRFRAGVVGSHAVRGRGVLRGRRRYRATAG